MMNISLRHSKTKQKRYKHMTSDEEPPRKKIPMKLGIFPGKKKQTQEVSIFLSFAKMYVYVCVFIYIYIYLFIHLFIFI